MYYLRVLPGRKEVNFLHLLPSNTRNPSYSTPLERPVDNPGESVCRSALQSA